MFENKEGQDIPQVVFRTRKDNDWVDVHSSQLFAGKTVIVFPCPEHLRPPAQEAMYLVLMSWQAHLRQVVSMRSSAYP